MNLVALSLVLGASFVENFPPSMKPKTKGEGLMIRHFEIPAETLLVFLGSMPTW